MVNTPETEPAETPTGNAFDKYGTTNPIEQRMMRSFFAALDTFVDGLAPRRILEVGIGEGIITERIRDRFPEADIVGIDLPDDKLAEGWRERDLSCAFADVTRLPFEDDTFDLILAIEVFEHFSNPELALAELQRLGSGTLVASVPFEPIWRLGNLARGRYISALGNTPGHINHWTRWGFSRFVRSRCEVTNIASPLPWTMVRATIGR